MTTYYNVKYDNEASGPFVAKDQTNLVTWTGGTGFIVTLIDEGSEGKLKLALVSGVAPSDSDVLTQNTTTADTNGTPEQMLYPAYMREDVEVPATGVMVWTGAALGVTHSFFYDGETGGPFVAGEILTFSSGETAEIYTVIDDGLTGELDVRFTSPIDLGIPVDDDTFTSSGTGAGVVNGVIHDRAFTPLHLHRLLSDLNDDEDIFGDDDLSRIDPTPSGKDTNTIINLLSTMVINDTIAQHMYNGSIEQSTGDTLYSGLNLQVTTPNADTQPVLIQNDAIVTDYWKNGFMPHSIDGAIRVLIKTRHEGADIDGKRMKGKLLEFGHGFFEGGTTLGTSTTALALFSAPDGNNLTASGTVAGAPYNTVVVTEGFTTIDYANGNGATEYYLKYGFGSASSLQAYERTKYIQRRGTAETLFGRDAQLFTGVNKNFAYNAETGNFTAAELVVWGTEVTYSGQTTNLAVGEVVTFSPSGAVGRVLYDNDAGATGVFIIALEGSIVPDSADTITGVTSAGDGDVDSVVSNTNAGTALLLGLDDDGTTGNLYLQSLTGLDPASGQEIFGATSNQTLTVNSAVASRTINNQFIGVYTGANYQTNFGIGLDTNDAIVGDLLRNLADVQQAPPNNQTGKVSGILEGDTITVYPWNGAATDINGDALPTFSEMVVTNSALTTGSTQIDVGTGNIPDNTPSAGWLRVERDSDNNLDLIEYSAHDSDAIFTLVGTAPSAAALANTVMRALIDEEAIADGFVSYQALKGAGDTQVAIKVKNGHGPVLNGPIKPYPTTATFGAGGFDVSASRLSDA